MDWLDKDNARLGRMTDAHGSNTEILCAWTFNFFFCLEKGYFQYLIAHLSCKADSATGDGHLAWDIGTKESPLRRTVVAYGQCNFFFETFLIVFALKFYSPTYPF